MQPVVNKCNLVLVLQLSANTSVLPQVHHRKPSLAVRITPKASQVLAEGGMPASQGAVRLGCQAWCRVEASHSFDSDWIPAGTASLVQPPQEGSTAGSSPSALRMPGSSGRRKGLVLNSSPSVHGSVATPWMGTAGRGVGMQPRQGWLAEGPAALGNTYPPGQSRALPARPPAHLAAQVVHLGLALPQRLILWVRVHRKARVALQRRRVQGPSPPKLRLLRPSGPTASRALATLHHPHYPSKPSPTRLACVYSWAG